MSSESDSDPETTTVAERPQAAAQRKPAGDAEPAGKKIGPYTVLRTLGQGAMGTVYAAYDPKLDRQVAIKVLRASLEGGSKAQARLVREAQALARVAHPNVVAVHEVGERQGEIYIVMEFVRGETLRQWIRAKPRRWREVVDIYAQAGRGLAAAHAAGVIHRDFKPDNVMLGGDGRVRVMDFGLARTAGPGAALADPSEISVRSNSYPIASSTLTAVGAVLGTPAYMAPEQCYGGEVDACTDQFAFGVALFEALFGARPFAGKNLRELMNAIKRGQVVDVPRRKVPTWLRRITMRALLVDPAARWPSMDALLGAIERGQRRARVGRVAAVVGAVSIAIAGGFAAVTADRMRRESACEAAGAQIEETWSADAEAAIRAAFVATGEADAEAMAGRVMPWLGRHADAWQQARTDACLDAEVREVWSADTYDRAMWCLDERRLEFDGLVDALKGADAAIIQSSVPIAAGLEPISSCRDAALRGLPTPPPEARDQARSIRAQLVRSDDLRRAGDMDGAMAAAQQARADAEALPWPPLVAAARFEVGYLLDVMGEYEKAARELEEAGFIAAEAGAFGAAADAASYLTTVVGNHLSRFDEGRRWSRFAGLAIREIEPTPGLRTATNLSGAAIIHAIKGELDDAQRMQEESLAIERAALGPDHPRVGTSLHNLALTYLSRGDYGTALEINGQALAIREAALGPDHNDVTRTLNNRSIILRRMGDFEAAKAMTQRVLEATTRARGEEHPDVAMALSNLANIYLTMGEPAEALPLQWRALQIREATLGSEHPEVASSLESLATYHQLSGDDREAYGLFSRALEIREAKFGPAHPLLAQSLGSVGFAALHLGRPKEAREHLERGLAMMEEVAGPDHPNCAPIHAYIGELELEEANYDSADEHFARSLAILKASVDEEHPDAEVSLRGRARVALARGEPAQALPWISRAIAVGEAHELSPLELGDARFLLARILWELPEGEGRDRSRALAQAQLARDAFKGTEGAQSQHAEVLAWLASPGQGAGKPKKKRKRRKKRKK